MSRRRGRPARQYRVRVRTERRDPIDYEALARATLEQAARDQQDDITRAKASHRPAPNKPDVGEEERDDDDVA